MNPKISIIAVNWWAKDFAKVLIKSVIKNTINPFELMIVDNSGDIKMLDQEFAGYTDNQLICHTQRENLGHGAGLDLGIKQAVGEYVLILDIDAHILLPGWDKELIEVFNQNKSLKMAAATDGGLLKPARPLAMFFEKKAIVDNNISFKAVNLDGIKFDVGVAAYFKILTLFGDRSVLKLPVQKTEYREVFGNEYCLNGKRFVYHNWYGTRWYNKDGKRVHNQIDGVKWEEFKIKRDNFFKQIEK